VVDESFVLPAVTALQGVPEVTEADDIVYTFPELQVSCSYTTTTNLHANTGNISTTATLLLSCNMSGVAVIELLLLLLPRLILHPAVAQLCYCKCAPILLSTGSSQDQYCFPCNCRY
jgi:hypothetical protein